MTQVENIADIDKNIKHEISDTSALAKNPVVTVLMITYNHADYLPIAIESIVNQQCDFPFELIIGEDSSTDNTLQIAIEYQKRYPKIIRVIHSEKNVGMNSNSRRIFSEARGEYIAYCEGDDYWCSTDKLALQVAMMRSDRSIGIVHCDWTRCILDHGTWKLSLSRSMHARVSEKYLSGKIFSTWHYPKILRTCTILLRKDTLAEWYDSHLMDPKYHFGDSILSAWITERSKVGYIPKIMSVYRVSPNSALRSGAKARVAFYKSALEFDTAARAFFSDRADYPMGYRWETAASLLLWGLRSHDMPAIKFALTDFKQHFSLLSFIVTAYKTLAMRLPTLKRQRRQTPCEAITTEQQP